MAQRDPRQPHDRRLAVAGRSCPQILDGGGDRVIVENRHEPTRVHLRTFVDERYKITVYRDHDCSEVFDLREDPGEVRNLWDEASYAGLKGRLLHRFLKVELGREPTRMKRIAGA